MIPGEILDKDCSVDEEFVDGYIHRVVVNSLVSGWRSVRSGVTKGSIWGPLLFNIFINNVNSGIKCPLSNFSSDTKLSHVVDMPEEQDAV